MTKDDQMPGRRLGEQFSRPALGDAAQARAVEREARRAAALRANLRRRKAQGRTRQMGEGALAPEAPSDGEAK